MARRQLSFVSMSDTLPPRYPKASWPGRAWRWPRALLLIVGATLFYGYRVVFGRTREAVDRGYRGFSQSVLVAFCAKVQAYEVALPEEALPPRVVMVSNHESNLDGPLVLVAMASRSIRFVVKRELLSVPVLGRALVSSGSVAVNRQVKGAGIASLDGLGGGAGDVLFFAEGTRSKDGRLQPFKKGAFHFAKAHGLPLLPIGLAGTGACLPSGSASVRPGPVAIVVGRPVPSDGTVEELRDRLFAEVSELRARAVVRASEGLVLGG